MRTVDIILKKREGEALSYAEIAHLIDGFLSGDIPDYQVSAWAMAVFFRGMSEQETADLTDIMLKSGAQVDLTSINGVKVDKHSTGGVGDKTTLVLVPLVAAAGVPVAKMSGRGLGHTGGTIDKFESFPHFSVSMSKEAFVRQVNKIGAAVIGQTENLTPADKHLYALRDVTATVDSIPLIASSIMSKKLAAGADVIVLDVKTGSGAFMKSKDDAFRLARAMVNIGKRLNRKTVAVVSDMNQPLGHAVGNALEVKEAIAALSGEGPPDLLELCLTLGSHMLMLAGKAGTKNDARRQLKKLIHSGAALDKLKALVHAQGGEKQAVMRPALLPQAALQQAVPSLEEGIVQYIDTEHIGRAAMTLGAGRAITSDSLDLAAGIVLHKKIGDTVEKGEPLATVHANDPHKLAVSIHRIQTAIRVRKQPESTAPPPLIYGIVE